MMELTEQFICPNRPACEAAIPQSHIVSNIDVQTGIRTVKAICPHCEQMHIGRYRLYGGNWSLIGQVERVTDERKRNGMKARIEHNAGHLQREAISA